MKYTVRIMPAVWRDVDQTVAWLSAHSRDGASRWYSALMKVIRQLGSDAEVWGPTPEATVTKRPIRQKLFRTPRGRPYRLLYTIVDNEVVALRVRGPGQPPLKKNEL